MNSSKRVQSFLSHPKADRVRLDLEGTPTRAKSLQSLIALSGNRNMTYNNGMEMQKKLPIEFLPQISTTLQDRTLLFEQGGVFFLTSAIMSKRPVKLGKIASNTHKNNTH